ncbi:ROK family protein [Brucellaceae bacterium C25G]
MKTNVSRSEGLRQENRRRILTLLRKSGQLSRTDIAAASGMSHSTVSAIINELVTEAVLIELPLNELSPPDIESRRGRPQVMLALNPAHASVIAVDIALNLIAIELVDYAGQVIARREHTVSTLKITTDALLDALSRHIDEVFNAHPAQIKKLTHIAVAVQGMTDAHQQQLIWSPTIGAVNVPIAESLIAHFQVPVTVSNDCLMIAEALRWFGPDIFNDDFAAILFSSGIGMGLFLKGQPFSGARSSAAEFGHIMHMPNGALCRCGRRGCLEAYASDYGIWRFARGVDENTPPSMMICEEDFTELTKQARASEGIERQAFQRAGKALGFALRSVFSLIDPVPLAFIGPGVHAFDLIEDDLRQTISGEFDNGIITGPQNGLNSPQDLSIRCYPSEKPLILQGCAITSLMQVDAQPFEKNPAHLSDLLVTRGVSA